MEANKILNKATSDMQKAVDHTLHEFNTVHTGKASPSMVESVPVEIYGNTMRIRDVAAISTPDARTIKIEPWDKSALREIEKGIQLANIGLNPVVRGNSIICPLPDLSRERRLELVKLIGNMAEQGKVGVRAARRDAMEALKKAEKDKLISEDDLKRLEKEVQTLTDKFTKMIDDHVKTKEKELMQI